jgi:DNA-binding NarL/FixJ family response regulator
VTVPCGADNIQVQQVQQLSSETGVLNCEGTALEGSTARIIVVDDYDPFRRFICSTLRKRPELQIVGEVSDGLEAVQKAEELQPDLIVLDIGLPSLNGIEAARRIRKLSPKSKILFVSQESSDDVVQEALALGALGYIVKADAGKELLTAVNTVLRGDRFVGSRFAGCDLVGTSDRPDPESVRHNDSLAQREDRHVGISRRHKLELYSNDEAFLDDSTDFIMAALKVGKAVILIATDLHQRGLLQRLQARGMDVAALVDQKRYISLDVADSLPTFMVDDSPDPVRVAKAVRDPIVEAAKAAKEKNLQFAVG